MKVIYKGRPEIGVVTRMFNQDGVVFFEVSFGWYLICAKASAFTGRGVA